MAKALTALQRVAAAEEATAGTPVAATRLMPHMFGTSFTEDQNRQTLEEARGVLAPVDDVVVQQGSTLTLQQELDFDLCLLAFLCGLGKVAAVGATPPHAYTIAAGVTAPTTKATATFEVLQSDGAVDHIRRRFGNARPTELSIAWQSPGTTQFNSTWMGEAAVAVPKAAIAATTIANRRVIPSAMWTIDIDDTWAALGTNAAANVRSLAWSLTTGLQPSYHLRGRTRLDLDGWHDGRLAGTLSLTLDLDAAAAAEIAHWRAGDLRFVRLAADNGATGAGLRSMQIDQAVRIMTPPNLLATDGEQATVALECQLRSDASGAADDFLEVTIMSGLGAWIAGDLLAMPPAPPKTHPIAS